MSDYYDGTKLLSLLDINGTKPEIYMSTSNRSAGKTTYFNRFVVNKFLKGEGKFGLLYRFNYELDDVADKFFKDIRGLFFNAMDFESKSRSKGIYHDLYLNGQHCGYALAINNADQIKKLSHLFSDVERLLFDEFQSETNHYCSEEVRKFISIHTSIARGQGKQVRYVPVYMISNPVTTLNPYYTSMKISGRLTENTKFLKGDGFVLEQGYVESVGLAQKESGFNRAFADDKYVTYSSESVYLNDSKSFIDRPTGKCRYVCTLKYNGCEYGLKEYSESGFIYCDDKADSTFNIKITTTTDDHDINYVMLKRNDFIITNLRYLFERGCFRFKDLRCKEAVLSALSY